MRTALVLALLLLGCPDTTDPRDPCGFGSTADDDVFDASFTSMELVRVSDGVTPDSADDRGPIFLADEAIGVRTEATADADVTYCVHGRDGSGELVDSQQASLGSGAETTELSDYAAGDYVVRVGQGETLIKNLPFGVD